MRRFSTTLFAAVMALCFCVLPQAKAQFGQNPFTVAAEIREEGGATLLTVRFTVPPKHFLYQETISVKADAPAKLVEQDIPAPLEKHDTFTDELKKVYVEDVAFVYRVEGAQNPLKVLVKYQGCDESVCFFPQKKPFELAVAGSAATAAVVNDLVESDSIAAPAAKWQDLIGDFEVVAQAAGYVRAPEFLAFLDGAKGGAAGAGTDNALADFQRRGLWVTVLILLVGGVALNLTPCVLPLIPINLAILGAGNKARSRGEGFALGGLYGLAMALVYGLLGLAVVLTGSKFGALNSSPWFNAVIAIVFVVMALAMFDILAVDFSRFQGRTGGAGQGTGGRYLAAFSMGAVAALLAGACVAPVLISTLLLASTLYAQGVQAALALPFLLGLGMGLPWPFAGAGLSFLPKPGAWMTRVKMVFGVMILGFAAYYGWLAYEGFRIRSTQAEVVGGAGGDPAVASTEKFREALVESKATGKPIFIDFWATWCKNCHAMEKTTFKDPEVMRRFSELIVLKYQAEDPGASPAVEVLDHFQALGLPTYVILKPK